MPGQGLALIPLRNDTLRVVALAWPVVHASPGGSVLRQAAVLGARRMHTFAGHFDRLVSASQMPF